MRDSALKRPVRRHKARVEPSRRRAHARQRFETINAAIATVKNLTVSEKSSCATAL